MPSEIGVRLTGDNSQFRSMMEDSIAEGQKSAAKLASKVGDKLLGLREVSTSVATALGLNFEKIADKAAGLFVGMDEAAKEAYKKIKDLSAQVADHNIALMRQRLNVEDQLKLSAADELKARKEVSDAIDRENAALKKTPSLAMLTQFPAAALLLLFQRQKDASKAVVDQQDALGRQIKSTTDVERLQLEAKQKSIALSEQAATLAANALDHAAKSKGFTEQQAALETTLEQAQKRLVAAQAGSVEQAKLRLEVQKAQFALDDLQLKHEQDGRLDINQQMQEAILLAKAKAPITAQEKIDLKDMAKSIADQVQAQPLLTEKENEQLKILALQTQEKKNQRDIQDILKQGVDNISADDMRQVSLLVAQNGYIDEQIAKRQKIVNAVADQVSGETDVAKFQERQSEIQSILEKGVGALTDGDRARLVVLAGQNSVLKEQIAVVQDLTKQFENFRVSLTRTGTDYQSQTTDSLRGVRDRLNSQLNQVSPNSGMLIKNADINSDFGAWTTANTIRSELAQIDKELNLRATITQYANQYGEKAATYKFGDTDTQRALRDLQSSQTNMANSLDSISNQLAASGLFPKNSPAPR